MGKHDGATFPNVRASGDGTHEPVIAVQAAEWVAGGTGADAAFAVSKAAAAAKRHYLTSVDAVILGAAQAIGCTVTITAGPTGGTGSTAMWSTYVGAPEGWAGVLARDFAHPLEFPVGATASIVMGGGAGITIAYANLAGYTR